MGNKNDEDVYIDEALTVCTGKVSYHRALAVVTLDDVEYDVPFVFETRWMEGDEYGEDYFVNLIEEEVVRSVPIEGMPIPPETVKRLEEMVRDAVGT